MSNCPFTNSPCPHIKNIHITEIAEGKVVEKNMCVICGVAYISKENPQMTNKLFGAINTVLKNEFFTQLNLDKIKPELKACPGCGYTLQDISVSLRIGCGECYKFFKEDLLPVITKCQMATKHVGKIPKRHLLSKLENDLKITIEKEEYEKAAEINKQIKELKNSTNFS